MSTGAEIQTLAESYIDEEIADADAILWINDFLSHPELIPLFRLTAAQSLTVADEDTWYSRTTGHLGIMYIADSNGDEYTSQFELNADRTKIRGLAADTYTITSYIVPTAITALSATPGINAIFHRACAAYIAGKYKLMDFDQNKDGHRLIHEGMQLALRAAKMLEKQDKRPQAKTRKGTWG